MLYEVTKFHDERYLFTYYWKSIYICLLNLWRHHILFTEIPNLKYLNGKKTGI